MSNEYLAEMANDMKSAIGALERELNTVRTGSASPALLDSVSVTVASYNATMPINQLATVSAPDPRLLVVSPWDKSTLGDVEKAIGAAGLGLNPSNDGNIIRVPVPALTLERRQEMVKLVRRFAEDCKIRIRGVRKDYNDIFRDQEADKEISKDDLDRLKKKVQESTDAHIQQVDERIGAKEKEILEV